MATYMLTASLSSLYNFFQFTTAAGVAALETALQSAYPDLNIQCYADAQTAGNALVVVNAQTALSVPPNNYVGHNQGEGWTQYPPSKMAGGAGSVFTAYP